MDTTSISTLQSALGTIMGGQTTNIDFCFVIDGTGSMSPLIENVKKCVINLYPIVVDAMDKYGKHPNQCRAKVIVFRDYYCDGDQAMEETNFYSLPEEEEEFNEYVSGIKAEGGGDAPENALEALSLAMKSEWETEGQSKRHIIFLFTDAPAHPLEKGCGANIYNYPDDMLRSYAELQDAWMGSGNNVYSPYAMDRNAERLFVFAPDTSPWSDLGNEFENCIYTAITENKGGIEIDPTIITDFLGRSVK